jgi:hypothetical protein
MELPPAMAMGLRNTQHVSLLAIITRSTIIELDHTQHAPLHEIAIQNPVIVYIVNLYDNP